MFCGFSFVTPPDYSFVPPSSTPFWSGTALLLLYSEFVSVYFCVSCEGRDEFNVLVLLSPKPALLHVIPEVKQKSNSKTSEKVYVTVKEFE